MATTVQKVAEQPVSMDQATIDMVQIARDTEVSTVFDRYPAAETTVQVRHRRRLLPPVSHGALPHHPQSSSRHLRCRCRYHYRAQPAA